MLELLSTLFSGTNAKATNAATDYLAMDLLDKRIRDAEISLGAARQALATLVVRQLAEEKRLDMLRARKPRLEDRIRQALDAGRENLAEDGAAAVADLENEETVRTENVARIDEKVKSLRVSVEKAHHRVTELQRGTLTARAFDIERQSQRRVVRSLRGGKAVEEAEALIRRIMAQDDPLDQAEVAGEIDRTLNDKVTTDRTANVGFGERTRVTATDVLLRIKSAGSQAA